MAVKESRVDIFIPVAAALIVLSLMLKNNETENTRPRHKRERPVRKRPSPVPSGEAVIEPQHMGAENKQGPRKVQDVVRRLRILNGSLHLPTTTGYWDGHRFNSFKGGCGGNQISAIEFSCFAGILIFFASKVKYSILYYILGCQKYNISFYSVFCGR